IDLLIYLSTCLCLSLSPSPSPSSSPSLSLCPPSIYLSLSLSFLFSHALSISIITFKTSLLPFSIPQSSIFPSHPLFSHPSLSLHHLSLSISPPVCPHLSLSLPPSPPLPSSLYTTCLSPPSLSLSLSLSL